MADDVIEFYRAGSMQLVATCHSSMVPPVGSRINIRKKTFQVSAVDYAVDYSGFPAQRRMRANVDLIDYEEADDAK